jgi:XTP/dITP diphosphohydrolase
MVEAREVCGARGLKVVAPYEVTSDNCARYGISVYPGPAPEIEETEATYSGNARLKADGYFRWAGLAAIADDAGLEVDALDGAPGVFSARFAGAGCTSQQNIDKLLGMLGREPGRSARFRAIVCCRMANGDVIEAEGVLPGRIAFEPKGSGGFGYDSVFIVEEFGRTLAELKEQGVAVKTHRILALEELCRRIGL